MIISIITSLIILQIINQDTSQNVPIKISVGTWAGYGDIFIAQEKGFFEKNNVKVKIVFSPSYPESVEVYNNGQTDGVYQTWPEAITSSIYGIDSKVVYVVDLSTTGDSIVGSGNSLSDLKGKTVGMVDIDGFSHIFVLKVLENANLSENDVRFKIVPPEKVPDELKSGQIAAGHTWEPYKSEAIQSGYTVLATDSQARVINDVLVFNSEIIKKRPNDVKAIIKSLSEARDYRLSNLNESISIMARGENMTNEEMKSGLAGLDTFSLEDNYKLMTSSDYPSLHSSGKFVSKFYINIGQLYKMPDLDELLDPEFVQEIMKENERQ